MDNIAQVTDTDITELVRLIFERATTARASDVHIEPTSQAIRIRYRIDGALYDQGTIPLRELDKILTRLKVLASLDIAARPTPQDGHFELDMNALARGVQTSETLSAHQKRILDVRISVFPTINGDAAVCRLLNREEALLNLDELGFDDVMLEKVRNLLSRTYGMVLVTGPSGAGKTTALYSILREIMGDEKNITTLEDPVEFRFDTIRQIQMQPERGMTFAVSMKSILRQDPDIIMVGEIRDQETAEHAVRASLIGRIVFSTIHSNTNIGTVARLIDMNVERSLIAYGLNGVISTRLVKKICKGCIEEYTPSAEYLKYLSDFPEGHRFLRGKGCDACNHTGYLGRTGIFEVLDIDQSLRAMIIDHASMADLGRYIEERGEKTLKQDAIDKVVRGITTIESVAHVI
jgi:type IV pilus assembly protein PilB